MMPHFMNNKRLARVAGVKFTLVPLAVLFLSIGIPLIAAENAGRPTAPISRNSTTEERQTDSLFPGDGKFLASLRFWEKDKPRPQPPGSARTTSRETSPDTEKEPATSPNASATSAPSSNSHVERKDRLLGDAPLPGHAANLHSLRAKDTPAPQNARISPVSHSSYSFDTRDWVEFFPLPEQNVAREETIMEIQATSYRLPATESTASPTPPGLTQTLTNNTNEENTDEENRWNGHATVLATHIAIPAEAAPIASTVVPVEKPNIDLSPSYRQRLQHTQTCGVVVVQANFPLTEIASILGEIEQLQHDLTHYIGVPAPKEKIELCLFKDEDSYINFLKEVFPRAPRDRRALYIKLDNKPGTLLVQKSKNFEVDLRHEMTHAIIHASIPKVPIWLDEGLAKYFEVPMRDRANNHPYMSQVRWNAKFGSVPSLDRLGKLETIDDMGAKEYRDSWAWVHFLIHRSPETHQLLAGYLQLLADWIPDAQNTGRAVGNNEYAPNSISILGLRNPRARAKEVPIPPLKLYLDDIIPNQTETFREHFGSMEK